MSQIPQPIGSSAVRSSVFDEPTCFFQHFDLSGSNTRVAKTVLSGYLDGSFLKAKPRGGCFAFSVMWV
ncbi:hypothetical protein RL2133 [Rhizobium johnstonii 3841]|uniref:Uncharacterized protein n=1 Tax=Rhizobium johnstonii (strain DSM 114642 / LMG 32736 / 3841) TaxID=216596 RepID=Q1MHD8_RHIJ3|nr:hypothetical protein RL2133 [Rhizobium johnstonii 3841]